MKDLRQSHAFEISSVALVVLIPTALFQLPILSAACDLALGFLLPFHGAVGTQTIIEDYLPNARWLKFLNLVVAVLAAVGLTNLNVRGDGIAETVKLIWRREKKPKEITEGGHH